MHEVTLNLTKMPYVEFIPSEIQNAGKPLANSFVWKKCIGIHY